MCRVLKLSKSGYYAWLRRKPSARAVRSAELLRAIKDEHVKSKGTYGSPRIHERLVRRGLKTSRKRVAALMHGAGVVGVTRRPKYKTTVRSEAAEPAADLVDRKFSANSPNELWVADITHVPTRAGARYLAIVLDVWSRKVVGWATSDEMPAGLVIQALEMAVARRRPSSVVHHSDQGSQYTSLAFTRLQRPRCAGLHRLRRRLLRQRHGRELLRHSRGRALPHRRPLRVPRGRGCPRLLVHRGLVQHSPAPQRARHALAGGVRTRRVSVHSCPQPSTTFQSPPCTPLGPPRDRSASRAGSGYYLIQTVHGNGATPGRLPHPRPPNRRGCSRGFGAASSGRRRGRG